MWGRVLDCLRKFRLIVSCWKSLYHNWIWKYLSTLHSITVNWFLNIWIALSALFPLWLLGGTNWYLMFMDVIIIFKAVDASLSMKLKPGLIPQILKYSVNDVRALIISLSLILFIYVVRMKLQPYTYIIYMYLPPCLKWWANVHIDMSISFLIWLWYGPQLCKTIRLFWSRLPILYQEVFIWLISALVFSCTGVPLLYSLMFQGVSWRDSLWGPATSLVKLFWLPWGDLM